MEPAEIHKRVTRAMITFDSSINGLISNAVERCSHEFAGCIDPGSEEWSVISSFIADYIHATTYTNTLEYLIKAGFVLRRNIGNAEDGEC